MKINKNNLKRKIMLILFIYLFFHQVLHPKISDYSSCCTACFPVTVTLKTSTGNPSALGKTEGISQVPKLFGLFSGVTIPPISL